MMSRGIVAGLLVAFAAFTVTACSPSPEAATETTDQNVELPSGMRLAADGSEVVWCAVSPAYQGTFWVMVTGDPTGGPCATGQALTESEFADLNLNRVCEVPVAGGVSATYFAGGTRGSRTLAEQACGQG